MARKHGKRRNPYVGFNDAAPTFAAHADQAAKAGSNVARFYLDVRDPNYEALDQAVDALKPHGIKPLILLTSGQKAGSKVIKRAAKKVAKRYDNVAGIEVWNEPNHPIGGNLSAKQFARVLKRTAKTIDKVSPDTDVIAGAAAPVGDWEKYMKRVYKKVPDRLDLEAAMHIYPGGPKPVKAARKDFNKLARISGDKTPWVTETGISKATYGDRQEELTKRLVKMLSKQGADAVILHRLLQPTAPGAGGTYPNFDSIVQQGAITPSGQHTALFDAIQSAFKPRRKKRGRK